MNTMTVIVTMKRAHHAEVLACIEAVDDRRTISLSLK